MCTGSTKYRKRHFIDFSLLDSYRSRVSVFRATIYDNPLSDEMTRICTRSNHCNLARKSRVKVVRVGIRATSNLQIRDPFATNRFSSDRNRGVYRRIGNARPLFSPLTDTFDNLNRILPALGYTGPFQKLTDGRGQLGSVKIEESSSVYGVSSDLIGAAFNT